jgi:hypothetical protein
MCNPIWRSKLKRYDNTLQIYNNQDYLCPEITAAEQFFATLLLDSFQQSYSEQISYIHGYPEGPHKATKNTPRISYVRFKSLRNYQ